MILFRPLLVGNNIALVIYGILMAQIIGDNLLAGWITNHFCNGIGTDRDLHTDHLGDRRVSAQNAFKINPNLALNVCAVPLFICYVVLYPISNFRRESLTSFFACLG